MTYQRGYKKFIFFLILTLFTFSFTNLQAAEDDEYNLVTLWFEIQDNRPRDKDKNLIDRRDFFIEELSRVHSKKINKNDVNFNELSILMEIYYIQNSITRSGRKIDLSFYEKYKFAEKHIENILNNQPFTLIWIYETLALDHLYEHSAAEKSRLLSKKHRFYLKKAIFYYEQNLIENNIREYDDFFKITDKRNIEDIKKDYNNYNGYKHTLLSSIIKDNQDKEIILEHLSDLYEFNKSINNELIKDTNLKDHIFTDIDFRNDYFPFIAFNLDYKDNIKKLTKTCFDKGLKFESKYGNYLCRDLATPLFHYYNRNGQYDQGFEVFQSYIDLNKDYDVTERNFIATALKIYNDRDLNSKNYLKFLQMREDLVKSLYLTSINSGVRDTYLLYALMELYFYDSVKIENTKYETIEIKEKKHAKNLDKLYEALNIAEELGLSNNDNMIIGLNMQILNSLSNYSIKKNNIDEITKIIKIVEQKNLHQDASHWGYSQTNFFVFYYLLLGRLTSELASEGHFIEAKATLNKFKNYKKDYMNNSLFSIYVTTIENYCYYKNDRKCIIDNKIESIKNLNSLINENNQHRYAEVSRGYNDLSRYYWEDNDLKNFLITTNEGYQALEKTLNLSSLAYNYGTLNQREFLNSLKTYSYEQSLKGLIQAVHINNYKNLKKYDVGIDVEIIDADHNHEPIRIGDQNNYILSKRTVKIISVREKSPASLAGLKKGDYIIAVDGYNFDHIKINDMDFYSDLDKYILLYIESSPNPEFLVVRENTQLTLVNLYPSELIKVDNIDLIKEKSKGAVAYNYLNNAFKATQLLSYSQVTQTYSNLYNRMTLQNNELSMLLKEYELITSEINKLQENQIQQNNKDHTIIDINLNYIQKKNDKLQEINKQINNISPNIERSMNIKLYELDQVQSLLGKNDSIIIPFNADNSYYTWFISKNLVHLFKPLPSNLARDIGIEFNVENIILGIDKKVNGTIEPREDYYYINHSIQNLYDMLIRQLQDNNYLENIKKITFITNEELSKIPLSILRDRNTKKYLIDEFEITNAINLSVFEVKNISLTYNTYQTFLGVGNPIFNKTKNIANKFPKMDRKNFLNTIFRSNQLANIETLRSLESLPETEDELKSISNNFKNENIKLLLKEDASEKKLKSLDLMKYDIISFATHTLPAEKNIENSQSGLVLSLPKQSTVVDDGILTPGEIASLNLSAKIVILSACNTAVGQYENSDSLSGLAESFIFAGAESLILSHWPVETEATNQLMQLFINNLKTKKMPRAKAFQQAIIELKKIEQFTHPLFWAGFSYYGT